MGTESHSFSLSFPELYKLLFRKKKCPDCGKPAKRIKEKTDKGKGWHSEDNSEGIQYEYGQKYEHQFVYRCDDCGKVTELRDI